MQEAELAAALGLAEPVEGKEAKESMELVAVVRRS
jgi:hypothetical protein